MRRARALLLAALPLACAESELELARAPRAFAGYDRAVTLGRAAALDGSQSDDPDGDALRFSWSLLAAPPGSSAVLSDSDRAVAGLLPDLPGTYLAVLAVSDGALMDGDLLSLTATLADGPAGTLELRVDPSGCAAQWAAPGGCGDAQGWVSAGLSLATGSVSAAQLNVAWVELPAGVEAALIPLELPASLPGTARFRPPRPGVYTLSLSLGGGARSTEVLFTAGVYQRPVSQIAVALLEARATATTQDRLLLDGRGSVLVPGTVERRWSLASQPAGGDAQLLDVATGCAQDECRLLFPALAGRYLVSLELSAGGVPGVPARHLIEVRR